MKPKKLVWPWFFKLPFMGPFAGIVIGRFMIFRREPDSILLNHELIHQEQMDRHGMLAFYFIYVRDYIRNRLKGMSHMQAYFAIPFEIEAYNRQYETKYML